MNHFLRILIIICACLISFLFSKNRHLGSVIDIDLSSDKKFYVSAGEDEKIFYCDAKSHQILKTFKYDKSQEILQVSISQDNNYLAAAFNNGAIEIINLNNNFKETLFTKNNFPITLLRFVGVGYLLYSNSKGENYLLNMGAYDNSIKLVNNFTVSKSKVVSTKINSNKSNILSRLESNKFARWDIGQTNLIKYLDDDSKYASNFRISGGTESGYIELDTTLTFASTKETKLIDPPSRSIWWNFPFKYYDFDISPDGSKIAIITNDNYAIIWNSNFSEKEVHIQCHNHQIDDIEFSNDGKYLATSSRDQTIKIWDTSSGKLLNTIGLYKDWATKIVFNNDILIYGTYSGDVNFFKIK